MKKIVLDTNILISGTFWNGASFKILELIEKNIFKLVISSEIIEEYKKILLGDEITLKVQNKKLIAAKIIGKLLEKAELTTPKLHLKIILKDPDDDKILECAKTGNADYIITKDKHLLELGNFEKIPILTPDEFLQIETN